MHVQRGEAHSFLSNFYPVRLKEKKVYELHSMIRQYRNGKTPVPNKFNLLKQISLKYHKDCSEQ